MKKLFAPLLIMMAVNLVNAQNAKEDITKACLNYIEGFYKGDTAKLIQSLDPNLHKVGYWKNKTTGKYNADGNMTYRQALDYAKNVFNKKNFAKQEAPKKVELLDIQNAIAAAKITAWWGTDYILLAKKENTWLIEQVLWEGPLQK